MIKKGFEMMVKGIIEAKEEDLDIKCSEENKAKIVKLLNSDLFQEIVDEIDDYIECDVETYSLLEGGE